MKKSLYILSFVFLVSLLFAGAAFAQSSTPPTDDQVNAVAHKLYCPVCESTPLDVCPTDACKDWREQIRTMLAEGKSEAEILTYFEDQYGARVLAEPPKKGFYWLVYLLPPALILAGAVILFRSMKAWTTVKADAPNPVEATSAKKDDYVARLEEELKKQK
ncbi:MAG: cytochrome c-type biogenesis protein CcmH [Anaerolineales bacterium]|nr:cytochrome c-type biogenesis protein CcmH [Anaerolineales bacterium]